MNPFELLALNLLSPVVLSFALGAIAAFVKSDLRLPEALYQSLSIYLLFAIGLKGGVAIAQTPLADLWLPAVATLAVGSLMPVWTYAVLRGLRFSVADAAALAAHYGSVSAVTFVAASTFVAAAGSEAEGFLPSLVALLEVPAIVVALLIAQRGMGGQRRLSEATREVLTGRSVVLLVGGLVIGALSGPANYAAVEPVFSGLFHGALALFLLELGGSAARRARDFVRGGLRLLLFGTLAPMVHGALGVVVGLATGLGPGGATVFGAMTASASYIAAPAAVRIALPEANPGYYLTGALAITFPFNLALGIPLYFALAKALAP